MTISCYVCGNKENLDGFIDYEDSSPDVDHISIFQCNACLCSVTITYPSQKFVDAIDEFLEGPHLRLVRKGDIE